MLHSSTGKSTLTKGQLEAKIVATSHVVEKGLTLPDARLGYGRKPISNLISLLHEYRSRGFDVNRVGIKAACGALAAYVRYHDEAGYDLGGLREVILGTMCVADGGLGGILRCTRSAIQRSGGANFEEFVVGRHSVRDFSCENVSECVIEKAVKIASRTPSTCNCQCWRVYWVSSAEAKEELLKLLTGCRGFGQSPDSFFVITSDLQPFSGVTERNQAFIDGGMFAMSLVYALHYLGLGTVCLNWATLERTDRKAHSALKIPRSERILLVVALGHLQEEFCVAYSARRPVSDLLFVR